MNRSRFLAAVVALVGLLGAAEVRSASNEHQSRLEEFQKKALKDRQAQGLDKNRAALFSKYPSPEVKLTAASGELPLVAVGSETTVTATGRFLPGSLAHVVCAGSEVLSEKVTDSRLEARVRVSTTALPGPCGLRVYSPVSLASSTREAFRVAGNYQWELSLSDGTKARMRTSTEQGNPLINGSSEWFGKDGKSLGTRPVRLDRQTEGFRVHVEGAAQDAAASGQAQAGNSSEDRQKQLLEIQQKMKAECLALPPAQMTPCIQKYSAQINAATQGMKNKAVAGQPSAGGSVGCELLALQVSEGKVTGKGSRCGALAEVPVTGTLTATK